ncbi:LysR family transcriptional regulator [Halobacillus litoralis]|uniref:LysR family transcriptional regulator n=1 Tax=Halobacillus litoralis TaxID=45668 RepID=UPI001CD714D5|nr:LysR family transcriptional regulator [Halobacillus litoralis]MCA0972504.1 LysR family transcriptional regulator [Halobacillus litoralis]
MLFHKLRYFIEIAKLKSYTKAAESFFISQPALSKQMKLLEEELGFRLFSRSSKGFKLTEKGQSLYYELEPLFNQIETTVHQYKKHDQVLFGSTPLLSSYFIHEHYEKLQRIHFQVTVIQDDSQDLIPFLKDHRIDAAIVQDIAEVEGLYSKYLFKDEFLAAIPSSFPLASKQHVTLDECLQHTQIIPTQRSTLAEQLRIIMNDRSFDGEVIETHYQAMTGLVSLGMGIAYLPSIMAEQIEYRGVTFVPISDQQLYRDMYLYATTKSMLDFLYDQFS